MKKLFSLKGRKELLELAEEIFELLNGQTLSIEDFTHHETILLSQDVGLDGDSDRYGLDANYRIVVS